MSDTQTQNKEAKKALEEAKESGTLETRESQPATPEAKKPATEAHEAVTATLETGNETPSEVTSESKEVKSDDAKQTAASTATDVGIQKEPLVIPESRKELTKEIDKELHKQLNGLKKEENKACGGMFRKIDAGKLTGIVAKIRQIQTTLKELVDMTIEALKNLYKSLFESKGL